MSVNSLRQSITAGALVIALAHLIFPTAAIDFVTVVLLLVAVLPWLAPIIKSVELPGGFKIELQDIKSAAAPLLKTIVIHPPPAEATATAPPPEVVIGAKRDMRFDAEITQEVDSTIASLRGVAGTDPNLAFVGFRIEIEKRLRDLAKRVGIDRGFSLRAILDDPRIREILPDRVRAGLADLIGLGNQAAHGRPVDAKATEWVFSEGAEVLKILDRLAHES